ncbi:hypothetical protein D3C76_1787700 [compost metagenome]
MKIRSGPGMMIKTRDVPMKNNRVDAVNMMKTPFRLSAPKNIDSLAGRESIISQEFAARSGSLPVFRK